MCKCYKFSRCGKAGTRCTFDSDLTRHSWYVHHVYQMVANTLLFPCTMACTLFLPMSIQRLFDLPGNLDFAMQASAGGVDSARVQFRARKLLQLCLNAFVASRKSAELQQQTHRSSSAVPWPKLLDLVIKLTGTYLLLVM